MKGLRGFISRWQEFGVWMPVLVLLALGGFVVFGALPGVAITGDLIAWMLELPVACLWLAAAMGAAWLFKATYLQDLDSAQEAALYQLVLQGNAHARWLLIKDRLEWAFLIVLFALFFWPAR